MAEIRLSTQDSSLYQSKNQNLPDSFEYAVLHNPNQDSVVSVKPEGGVTALYEFLVKPVLPSVLSSLNDLPQKAVHLFGEIKKNPQYQKAVAEAQARKLNDEKESEKIDKLYQASVSLGLIPQPENVFIGVSLLLGLGCSVDKDPLEEISWLSSPNHDENSNDYREMITLFDAKLVGEGLLNSGQFESGDYKKIAESILKMMRSVGSGSFVDKSGVKISHSDVIQLVENLHKRFEITCKAAERNNHISQSIYKLWMEETEFYHKWHSERTALPYAQLNNLYQRAEERDLLSAKMYTEWLGLVRDNEFIKDKSDARQVFAIVDSARKRDRLSSRLLLELTEILWNIGEYEELVQLVNDINNYMHSGLENSTSSLKTFFYDELGNTNPSIDTLYHSYNEYLYLDEVDLKYLFDMLNYRRRALLKLEQYKLAFMYLPEEASDELKDRPKLLKYKDKLDVSLFEDFSFDDVKDLLKDKKFRENLQLERYVESEKANPAVYLLLINDYMQSQKYQEALQACEDAYSKRLNNVEINSLWMTASLHLVIVEIESGKRQVTSKKNMDRKYGQLPFLFLLNILSSDERLAKKTVEIYEKASGRKSGDKHLDSIKYDVFNGRFDYSYVVTSYKTLGLERELALVVKEAVLNGLIDEVYKLDDLDNLLEKYTQQEDQDPFVYQILIKYYRYHRKFNEAIQACKEAESRGIYDPKIYSLWILSLRDRYASKGKDFNAKKLAKEIIVVYEKSKEHNARVQVLKVSFNDLDYFYRLSYRLVLYSYRFLGREQEAEDFINEAVKNGFKQEHIDVNAGF